MTKIVTATAVIRLAETGSLDLDDPLTNYFPDFSIDSGGGEALIYSRLARAQSSCLGCSWTEVWS
jgi:CubicO group peptidase (beta-lactamase class C family)